jgi:hypothetical protein
MFMVNTFQRFGEREKNCLDKNLKSIPPVDCFPIFRLSV